jgi:hypothetical protein
MPGAATNEIRVRVAADYSTLPKYLQPISADNQRFNKKSSGFQQKISLTIQLFDNLS